MKFEVAVFRDTEVIGAEVTVFNEGVEIDKITVTDAKSMNKINSEIEEIIKKYISTDTLNSILENKGSSKEINATKLNGHESDHYSTASHTHDYAPLSHANEVMDYGAGTEFLYGHVKTINRLTDEEHVTGRALSAHQGKVLDDKITSRGGYFKLEKNILDEKTGDLVIYCYEADGTFMTDDTEIELKFYYFDDQKVGTPQTIKVGEDDQGTKSTKGAITRRKTLIDDPGRPFCISVNKKDNPSINMSAILSTGLKRK